MDQPDLDAIEPPGPPGYIWRPMDDDTSTDTFVALYDEDAITQSSLEDAYSN